VAGDENQVPAEKTRGKEMKKKTKEKEK